MAAVAAPPASSSRGPGRKVRPREVFSCSPCFGSRVPLAEAAEAGTAVIRGSSAPLSRGRRRRSRRSQPAAERRSRSLGRCWRRRLLPTMITEAYKCIRWRARSSQEGEASKRCPPAYLPPKGRLGTGRGSAAPVGRRRQFQTHNCRGGGEKGVGKGARGEGRGGVGKGRGAIRVAGKGRRRNLPLLRESGTPVAAAILHLDFK
ncbi:uncharacterized protein ACOB8E_014206 [Sarcophilus harrisii]